ncbi:MAG: chemotaxis protein CheW [Phycisphaeraceae bacterium]|nr:MAG: chemotaxis protein CheW [Phycisphaeraceae bacterium]
MDATGPVQKLLSFGLGNEEYGLDILAVREIIGLIDVTPLPRTPDYVKGVINLRGKIIPVIELRARFGMPSVKYTDETCIIVVDVPTEGEAESRLMGVVVDTVREVLDIPAASIEPPPEFGCSIPMDYITGIGKVKDKVVVMLDTAKVMNPADAEVLGNATKLDAIAGCAPAVAA